MSDVSWREALGALRMTLSFPPDEVDVERAKSEVEVLVWTLNKAVGCGCAEDPPRRCEP